MPDPQQIVDCEFAEWCCRSLMQELLQSNLENLSIDTLEGAKQALESGANGLLGCIARIENEEERKEAYMDLALTMEGILRLGMLVEYGDGQLGGDGENTEGRRAYLAAAKNRRCDRVASILRGMFEVDPVSRGMMTNDHLLKLVLEKLEGGASVGKRTLERARKIAWP